MARSGDRRALLGVRACASYRTARARTAAPAEVVVELMDAALRSLARALAVPKAGRELIRAHAVIAELQAGLQHARAPDLCRRLDGMYDFMRQEVLRAYVRNDPESLGRVQELLRSLRGLWLETSRMDGTFLANDYERCLPARPP